MTAAHSDGYSLSDIDHHAPYFVQHHYEIYDKLREKCPIAHSTAHGGFYFFLGYDEVFSAYHDLDTFSSGRERSTPVPMTLIPLDADPPMHEKYRKLSLQHFTVKAAKNIEPEFRRVATGLIDEFIESGEADLVKQLTTPLPSRWILQLLGFDESRWPEWVEWILTMVLRYGDSGKREAAISSFFDILAAELQDRRTNGFRDDLLSTLMQSEIDGVPLTDDMVMSYAFLMILAGIRTTSALTGNALVQIARQPALRERLIKEPEILPMATEEFLRYNTPSSTEGRVVKRDCVFKGQQLRPGDRVLLGLAAANRDPRQFADPDVIDFDRSPNRHVAFGVGPHRCLGSNHARLMFQVMISEILERLPDFEINGNVEYFPDAGDIYAVKSLPVRFTPGPHSSS
jgi:cytochrome P450